MSCRTFRCYRDELKRDVEPICTAVNATAARATFDELAEKWGGRCPAVVRLGDHAWSEFIPFLDYDVEIRTVICSTNAIESLNARDRRAIKARGQFPNGLAALKCLRPGQAALDAFAITFVDRFTAAKPTDEHGRKHC